MKFKWILTFISILISLSVSAQFANVSFWKLRKPFLKITSGAQIISALNCSGVVTVQALTASNIATNLSSPLVVNLSATGTTFYSDSNCATQITSVTIAAGTTTANFYFTVSSASSPVITASATNYKDGQQTEIITTNPYIWTGGGANSLWTTAANWSGGAAPGGGSQAIFNGTCVSNCSPTLNANMSIGGIRMLSGYTGTITQSSTYTVTVGVFGWYQEAGTFVGGSNTLTLNGNFSLAGGSFTSTSGSNIMNGAANFAVVGGTATIVGTYGFSYSGTINSGSTQFQNVSFTPANGQTMNITGTMYVAGNLTLSHNTNNSLLNGGTVDLKGNLTIVNYGFPGSATIKLTGSGTQNIDGSAATAGKNLPNLTIASTGPVNLSGNLYLVGNYTYTSSGTFNAGTSVIGFANVGTTGVTATMGPGTYYDMVYASSRDVTFTQDAILSHKLTVGCVISCNGNILGPGKIKLAGDLAITSGALGTGTISLNGSTNQTVTTTSNAIIPPLEINSTGGVITFPASFTFWGSFTYIQGTIAGLTTATFHGSSAVTITPGSYLFPNVIFSGFNGYSATMSGTMNISGNMTYNSPGNANMTGSVNLYGNYTFTTYSSINVTTTFMGSATQSITGGANCTSSTGFNVNKTGGLVKLMNAFYCSAGSFSQTSGNFDMNGFAFDLKTLSTLNGNTLTKSGGTLTVNGATIGTGSLFGGTIAP